MSIICRSITAANSFPATLQCIFGCIYGSETTSRLKQMGMEFTVWVFKHSQINRLKLMAPVILNAILKSLDNYSNLESDATARDTKTFAFQAIGLLAQRMPQLFRDKIDMAVRLFGALKVEPQSFRFIIQEATISLSTAYKGAPETVLKDLETPLLISSQEEQSEVRYCAVRWATYLFDLQHCPSRFICMLGAADSSLDIREMALEGLFLLKDDGLSESGKSDLQYPKLGVMLDYILGQQPKLLDSTEMRGQRLLFPSKTYVVMIKFLLKCFQSEFEQSKSIEGLPVFQSAVENMCLLLEHAMAFEGSVELHANASKALIVIGSCIPEMISSHYARKVSWIKQLLDHVDLDTHESAARLLGIVSSNLPVDASSAIISELIASVSGTQKLRVGVANFISLLVQKVGVDVKPYTSILLKLLFPVVKEEKSGAAKRAFASACAIVLKYAATSQAQKLIEDTAALHTGDRNAQITCAILLKSYSSMASDVLSGYHASIIPVIFLSRFEDDKQVSGLFEELWEENTSSEWIALQLYLAEVVSLICESITSSSWSTKKKSGKAICKLNEVLGEYLDSHHDVLLQAVMKVIPGRLWELILTDEEEKKNSCFVSAFPDFG